MRKEGSAGAANQSSYTHSGGLMLRFATSDEEILACFPALKELRPHLTEEEFVPRVRRQQQAGGYRLAYAFSGVEPRAAAAAVASACGFRVEERLASGLMRYIDDLVTLSSERGRGHGGALLDAVITHARELGCEQVHLDSGFQRYDAHRLYLNHGFLLTSHHFALSL